VSLFGEKTLMIGNGHGPYHKDDPEQTHKDMGEAMLWAQLDDAVRNRDIETTVSVITSLCTHRNFGMDERVIT